MTTPKLSDLSGRVYQRRAERRAKYRAWAQFFGVVAVQCCVATFVVPTDPWWAQYGFGGIAALCVLGCLNSLWRLSQNRENRD